jgi:DNA (cytosine-5)-methyltransferase 1
MLVLSLFPGIGLLDLAFEEEGFCVVRGPDVLWGGDVRRFHPPAGKFYGIIGGPPCQSFSACPSGWVGRSPER